MPHPGPSRLSWSDRPLRLLGIALALHLAAWTAVPALLHPIMPMDVIEQITWGRYWLIGNAKHPPLAGWLSEAAQLLSGGRSWSTFLLSQLFVLGTALGVFALARRIVGIGPAVLAAIAIEGLYYANFMSAEFNANVVQYPFWAAAGWLLHRATREGRWFDWAGLGLVLAAVLYGKYSVPVLILPLMLYTLADPVARPVWRTSGPYLAMAVFLAATAPNLYWLLENDYLPFRYALGRGHYAAGPLDHLLFPAKFLRDQAIAAAPALLLIGLLGFGGRDSGVPATMRLPDIEAADRRFLAWIALGPVATTLLLSAANGQDFKSHWGSPMLFFVPLLFLVHLRPTITLSRLKRFLGFAGFLLFLSLAAWGGHVLLQGHFLDRPHRATYPVSALSAAIAAGFEKETGRPLRYVIGPLWQAGNVAFYHPDRPHVLIDADPRHSPWVDADDLRRAGAVIVDRGDWEKGSPREEFLEQFPEAVPQPLLHLPWDAPGDHRPVPIGWAILYPADN